MKLRIRLLPSRCCALAKATVFPRCVPAHIDRGEMRPITMAEMRPVIDNRCVQAKIDMK